VARGWTTQQCLNYNAALDLMDQPSPGVRIRGFRPLRPMPVGAFTIARHRILAVLASGHDEAVEQISSGHPGFEPVLPADPLPK
jgi:hypothetical protein